MTDDVQVSRSVSDAGLIAGTSLVARFSRHRRPRQSTMWHGAEASREVTSPTRRGRRCRSSPTTWVRGLVTRGNGAVVLNRPPKWATSVSLVRLIRGESSAGSEVLTDGRLGQPHVPAIERLQVATQDRDLVGRVANGPDHAERQWHG